MENPTRPPLRFPDFLCLGVQKGGTTSLYASLRAHPAVYLPQTKEVQYFSNEYARGEAWYASFFAAALPGQRCGECTPYYFFHPAAPRRIQALLPSARLIVLLRDPVERALSGYFHSLRLGLERLPIDEAFARERVRLSGTDELLLRPHGVSLAHQSFSYVARSRYEEQLARYLEVFDRSQLLLVRSEDLFATPAVVWPRILRFLDLPEVPLASRLPHLNAGRGEADDVDPALRRRLRDELEPTYAVLAESYGIRWP